jgi:hypothetical protein
MELSSMSCWDCSNWIGVGIAACRFLGECGVKLVLIWAIKTSGDGEMKVGLGLRDRDSKFRQGSWKSRIR